MIKRDYSGIMFLAFIVVALSVAASVKSPYHAGLLSYAAVLGIFAVSVNLVFGYLGYVTFGHAVFLGLGAYTAGLLATNFGWNYWTTLPLALLPGACIGGLVGFTSLRLGGAYFAIASLTVAEVFRLLAANWIDLTRGPLGIVVPPAALPGSAWHGIGIQEGSLGTTLILGGAAVFIVFRLMRGPHGRAWIAIRQSLALAEAIGIPTLRYRVANIAFSGALASLAGFLLVPKIFVLTPDLFGPNYSATGLLAVILGGKGTVIGPLLGGAIFAVLPEMLRAIDEIRLAVFALLLLVVVWTLPGGLISFFRRPAAFRAPEDVPVSQPANLPLVPRDHKKERDEMSFGSSPILEVDRLTKSFGGLRALHEVSFRVRQGEILGLIGPNGAGKTTCLNLLCGTLKPDGGSVRFLGADIAGLRPHRAAQLGIGRTFQQTTLFADLTVRENALIATHLLEADSVPAAILRTSAFEAREVRRLAAADEVLKTVGLLDRADAAAGRLAYGEQRMLAIALALVTQPKLLLLDEPAAGLNQTEAAQLARLLSHLRDRGMTVVIIDHNLRVIMSVCDRVVVLHHGEKLADAAPRQVRSDPHVIQAYLGGVEAETVHARG